MAWQGLSEARILAWRGTARQEQGAAGLGTWAGVTTSKHTKHTRNTVTTQQH